jgi:hypothetical protein
VKRDSVFRFLHLQLLPKRDAGVPFEEKGWQTPSNFLAGRRKILAFSEKCNVFEEKGLTWKKKAV